MQAADTAAAVSNEACALALQAADTAAAVSNEAAAEACIERGDGLEEAGDLRGAAEEFTRAAQLNPSDTEAWSSLGNVLRGLTRPAEAAVAYERAVASDPTDPDLLLYQAAALSRCGALEEAARCIDAALELMLAAEERDAGAVADGWVSRGVAAFGLGHAAEAAAYYDRALAEVPGLLLATWCVNRIGRVATCAGCMLLASLCLFAVGIGHLIGDAQALTSDAQHAATTSAAGEEPPSAATAVAATAQLLLIALCRMAAFGGFSSLYVLTAESFPTRLRATAFGIVSAAARLSGTVTPFVAGTMWAASPGGALLSFAAGAALCALVLRCLVADTGQRPMPDELRNLISSPVASGQELTATVTGAGLAADAPTAGPARL